MMINDIPRPKNQDLVSSIRLRLSTLYRSIISSKFVLKNVADYEATPYEYR